jgi:hypothetical protein
MVVVDVVVNVVATRTMVVVDVVDGDEALKGKALH